MCGAGVVFFCSVAAASSELRWHPFCERYARRERLCRNGWRLRTDVEWFLRAYELFICKMWNLGLKTISSQIFERTLDSINLSSEFLERRRRFV